MNVVRASGLVAAWVLVAALPGPAAAQESASYRITGGQFTQGGQSGAGSASSSSTFRVDLGSIGQAVAAQSLTGPSYQLDVGFSAAFRPPGEVRNLVFAGAGALRWDAHPSAGDYALYRGVLLRPFDADVGVCQEHDLVSPAASTPSDPPPSAGYFYLVTVRNRLDEEGTQGRGSATPRPNTHPCPP